MELYLVILTIFFLRVYSYETFLKTVIGTANIECDQNSLFVTNDTSLLNDCNMKNSCLIPANKVIQYYCVKRQFHSSTCYQMKEVKIFTSTGCYFAGDFYSIGLSSRNPLNKYYHFLPLYKALSTVQEGDMVHYHSTFSFVRPNVKDKVVTNKNSWFLLKVSNKIEEDFGEFFAESSRIPIKRKPKGVNTSPMITTLKEKNQSILEGINTSPMINTLKERNQSILEEKTFSVQQVLIIVGIVMAFQAIFLLAAFVFYRKRPRKETGNGIRVIPLVENERTGNSLADNTVTRHQFNNRLGVNVANETPLIENVRIGNRLVDNTVTHQQFNNRRGVNVANETPLAENQYDRLSDVPEYIDCM